MALAGCASVAYPTETDLGQPGPSAGNQVAVEITNSNQARRYIAASAQNMRDLRHRLRMEEVGGDIALAAAGITAITAAAFKWSSNIILGATLGGGSAYTLTRGFNPRGQEFTLDEGIKSLMCIDATATVPLDAADTVGLALTPVRETLGALREALANLAADTSRSRAQQTIYESALAEEHSASLFLGANIPTIYQQVRVETDKVIEATNELLLKESADPNAFAALIKTIGSSANPGTFVPTTAPAPPGNGPLTARAMGAAPRTPYAELKSETKDVQNAVAAAKKILSAVGAKQTISFAGCIPGAVVLQVAPATKVTVKPGDTYDLTVTGGQYVWSWNGTQPADAVLTARQGPASQIVVLKAKKASQQPFVLRFTPIGEGAPVDVTVKVNSSK